MSEWTLLASARANFGVKLSRPGAGPAAELPAFSPAWRRHGGCSSPVVATQLLGGNRRAALASTRGTGRAAYTKDVGRTRSHRQRPQRRRNDGGPAAPVATIGSREPESL